MNQNFAKSLLAFGVKRFRIYEQIVFVIVWEKGRYWHIPSISNTPSIEHRTDTFSISDCLNVPSPILPAIEYRLFLKTIIRCDTNVPFIVWNNANSPRGLGTIFGAFVHLFLVEFVAKFVIARNCVICQGG